MIEAHKMENMRHNQLCFEFMSDKPSGCWNCQYADIDGVRPKKHVPGLVYRAACENPLSRFSSTGNIYMTTPRLDLAICEWWK